MQYVKTVDIDGRSIEYIVKKRKGMKTISLSVLRGGLIRVVIPYHAPLVLGERYVEVKKEWLKEILSTIPHPLQTIRERELEYKKRKKEALDIITTLLNEFEREIGYGYNRVSVRMTSSRWGSCSQKKVLSFDYRIVFLKPDIQRYLVAHEYCHLKEMNHGERFWSLVRNIVPNYKELRRELHSGSNASL